MKIWENKEPGVTGRDYYREIYVTDLEEEVAWTRRIARHKADSIELLLRRNRIECGAMLELGCGTGAVIGECQRRGLARRYLAVDFSEEAIAFLEANSEGIETMVADVTDPAFSMAGPIDVLVLSHVIEHLEDPGPFLESIRKIDFSFLIAEVPLDDLLSGKLAGLFVSDRSENIAGHVQFFRAASFRRLLRSSGLTILDERRYLPLLDGETIRYVCRKNSSNRATLLRMVAGQWLRRMTGPLWSHVMSANFAALCRK